jgi:serine/threonine-protein kinase
LRLKAESYLEWKPMVGRILGNRYEIVEELGSGGMAVVYKGRDKFLDRPVTIKVLRSEFTLDDGFVRRFQREARAVASLSHPNIVSIYDVGQEENIHYLVMEYVHGYNLKTVIAREGPLAPERAVHIIRQICEATTHAHENNIVHRDVKPHNILITREGWAKLTDFGIAREVTGATLTYTDSVIGSVHYLSPEQARGQLGDPKSDMYSLGVVLYEMLTGSVPYQGNNLIAVAIKHIQEEPEPPSRLNGQISPQLEGVILRSIAKEPSQRFNSVREMSFYLQEAVSKNEGELAGVASEGNRGNMDTRVFKHPGNSGESEKIPAQKKRRLRPLSLVIAGLLLMVLLAGAAYAFNKLYFNVPEVQVSDVVNKSEQEARDILTGLGLKVAVVKEHSTQVAEGYVVAQDIGPDDPKVKPPRRITLTISLGPDMREVPDLYKLNLTEAKIKLGQAGLKINEPVQEGYDSAVSQGYIFRQEPQAGDRQPEGSRVTVYVSLGPPLGESQAPSLVGLTIDQARVELNKKNLKLDENFQWAASESAEYLSGQIITQQPAAGSTALEGTSVKVVVSRGPGPPPRDVRVKVPVPDDGQNHEVRISLEDIRGMKDVYVSSHAPGDEVVKEVRFYGRGTVRIYIDNSLVKQKTY